MNIEKLPSGSYRITQMYEGKRYRMTVDHKPTAKEAVQLLAKQLQNNVTTKGTFRQLAEKYIASKENVLSPATVREYSRMCDRLPQWFVDMPVHSIDTKEVQRCVNEIAVGHSPKTVKDRYGFISAVMGFYNPEARIVVQLPQRALNEPAIPLDGDVVKLLSYLKENEPEYYVPVVLACYSMRRSEICALRPEDITGNTAYISRALVENKDKKWVTKSTKTTKSERKIPIPQDVVDMIKEQGYVYQGFPGQITKAIHRANKKLGLEDYSLHKLRHYFASKLLDMNIDQKTIQELGGWSGNETVSRIYQHSLAMKDKGRIQTISDDLAKAIIPK